VVDVWQAIFGNKNTCMMWYGHIPTYYLFILLSSDIIRTFTGVISVVCFSLFVVSSIPRLHAVMIIITLFYPHFFEFLLVCVLMLFCHVCCNEHGNCFTNACVIPYSTSLSSPPSYQERMVVPHRGCFLII